MRKLLQSVFPLFESLENYSSSDLKSDFAAGITIGVMLIPQGMAYAMLAGLPPIYGLYAGTLPLIVYALLGTSRHLGVGPVAIISLLVASGLGPFVTTGSSEYVSMAILLALCVGILQFLLGVFRLGFLLHFISHSVIAGFTSAAAIIIATSQLKHLLGMQIEGELVFDKIFHVLGHLSKIHFLTFVLGAASIISLILLKRISPRFPRHILVVILGMIWIYFTGWSGKGVRIISDIPSGLPTFSIPDLNFEKVKMLLPTILMISFVAIMESMAVAKAIHSKDKKGKIRPNQELKALGLANIFGSFFQSFTVTGSFSRTAVNYQAGGKTGISSLFSAALIIITLLFLTPYFYYLPNAILAAIIMVAVSGLIDIKEAKHLWKHDKRDFAVFIITFLATLLLGVELGIPIGVITSMILLLHQVTYPNIAELGRLPDSRKYRDVIKHDNLEEHEDIFIMRFDARIYFANAELFRDFIEDKLRRSNKVEHVIIDASCINSLDATAFHMMNDLAHELEEKKIKLYFANVKSEIKWAMLDHKIKVPPSHFYQTIHNAVNSILGRDEDVSHDMYVEEL